MLERLLCVLSFVFGYFTCESMENHELKRCFSHFEELHLSKIKDMDANNLMIHLEKCVLNQIPDFIRDTLLSAMQQEKYRRIIQYVIAKVEPYVDCASSLRALASGIPDVIGVDQKALSNAFLIYEKLLRTDLECTKKETHDYDFSMTFLKTQMLVNRLENAPISFSTSEPEELIINKTTSAIDCFKSMWGYYKKIILSACPLIVARKTFELVEGDESIYEFDSTRKCYRIAIESQPLLASAITGPLLRRNGSLEPHSYKTEKRSYPVEVAVIHELHHHITNILDKNATNGIVNASDFSSLSIQLSSLKCDSNYVAQLEVLWSNMNDFRNITAVGFFADGSAFYDPFTEGAVVDFIRASHLGSDISNVPTSLVDFIRQINPNVSNIREDYEEEEFKSWV